MLPRKVRCGRIRRCSTKLNFMPSDRRQRVSLVLGALLNSGQDENYALQLGRDTGLAADEVTGILRRLEDGRCVVSRESGPAGGTPDRVLDEAGVSCS
jgi:hypothetical protein